METNPLTAFKIEIPDPPEEFGQDGGKFYRAYDTLAEEIDDDMTQSLKEQLDGMLIFAGLFAGVNSAFLALTLPLMSADPADDTNALLAQNNALLSQLVSGRNDSTSLDSTLPSASFAPSGTILSVNVLFALSLAFAIISSFLAVLGRQWLVYYRKRGGGGPDRQRWEQLKRFLGAERWGLELILDDILPSLLQTGLIIFCISFIIYLNTLNSTLSKVVGVPLYMGLAFFVGSALCTLWDRFCPYHSPLSHLLLWISSLALRVVGLRERFQGRSDTIQPPRTSPRFSMPPSGQISPIPPVPPIPPRRRRPAFVKRLVGWLKPIDRPLIQPFSVINATVKKWFSHVPWTHREENMQSLEVIAVQRAICTSEDPAILLHAAANILSITDLDQLKQLWGDELFRERFLKLRRTSYDRAMQLRGRDQFDFAASEARLYCASATHVLISIHSPEFDSRAHFRKFPRINETNGPCIWVPRDRLPTSSPLLIQASLAFSAISTFWLDWSNDEVKDLCARLDAYCTALNEQSWRLLPVICWIVLRLPRTGREPGIHGLEEQDLEYLSISYAGSNDTPFANLDSAFTALLDPKIESLLDRGNILTNLLRCLVQIVDKKQDGRTIKPVFKLLAMCETVLRRIRLSEEARQMLGMLRIGGTTAINDLIPSPNAHGARIPWSILDALNTYFEGLLSIIREERKVPETEGLNVLQIFSPVMRQIFLYKPGRWSYTSVSRWSESDIPAELLEKRNAVRQTFNSFVWEVDKHVRTSLLAEPTLRVTNL
ncbi:hypothetical protein FRC04_010545 [Tulasnella sp. 424]|nr:hypothetical protein FRC04_010545 [Tulasnella sp. 424]